MHGVVELFLFVVCAVHGVDQPADVMYAMQQKDGR